MNKAMSGLRASLLLLLLLPALCHGQQIRLSNPANDQLDFGTVTHAGLGTTVFTPGAGYTGESKTVTIVNESDEALSLALLVLPIFKDTAFYIEESAAASIPSFTKVNKASYTFTLPAGGEATLPFLFEPVHNIDYNSEALIKTTDGASSLSIDLRGTGTWNYSLVPKKKTAFDGNDQPESQTTVAPSTYEGTAGLSENALLSSLQGIVNDDFRSVPPDLTSSSSWNHTRRVVFYYLDNTAVNPWEDPAPDNYKPITKTDEDFVFCPYTGHIQAKRSDRNNEPDRFTAISVGENRLPIFESSCIASDFNGYIVQVEHGCPVTWWSGSGGTSSAGNKREPAYHDLNHLFAIQQRANGSAGHSNFLYGDPHFDEGATELNRASCNTPTLEKSNLSINSDEWASMQIEAAMPGNPDKRAKYFYPDRRQRGAVARALLYFVTKYGDQNIKGTLPGTYGVTKGWWEMQKEVINYWNDRHPVIPRDLERSRLIEYFQNTRNPYVDYPQFAWRISVMNPGLKGKDQLYSARQLDPAPTLIEMGDIEIGEAFTYPVHIVNAGNDPIPVDSFTCMVGSSINCEVSLQTIARMQGVDNYVPAENIPVGDAGVLLITLSADSAVTDETAFFGPVTYRVPDEEQESAPFSPTLTKTFNISGKFVTADLCSSPERSSVSADATSVRVDWGAMDPSPDFVEFSVQDLSSGASETVSVTGESSSATISGLRPDTRYSGLLKSLCGSESESGGAFSFSTQPLGNTDLRQQAQEEALSASVLILSPNPANDRLLVTLTHNNTRRWQDNVQIRIVDTRGAVLQERSFLELADGYALDLSAIRPGTYLLECTRENTTLRSKFIIAR